MASWREIVRLVENRANGRCEYCQMHQSLQGATFHIEHIVPRLLDGDSDDSNLAWCCPSCNLHKSRSIDGLDALSGNRVRLFNPRLDAWAEHFGWEVYRLIGRTPIGRATASLSPRVPTDTV